jgi:hypothetical protein
VSEVVGRRSRRIGVILLAALGLLVWAAPAAADEIETPCPPDDGRQFCITISDTDGVSPSPDPETGAPPTHMRYVVTVKNVGKSTLTHGLLEVALTDLPLGAAGVTTASLASASSSRGDVCDGLASGGAVCDFGRLTSGQSFKATLAYRTSHTDGVVRTRMDASVSVKERGNEQGEPGDPTPEVRTASNTTHYETRADFGSTFVPDIRTPVRVATSLSSLSFTTPGLESFFTEIQDYANDPSHCFEGAPCRPQSTRGDLSTTDDLGPFLWKRPIRSVSTRVSAGPLSGSHPSDPIVSVHFSDPIQVAVNPSTNKFSAAKSFVGIDGVRFSTNGSLPGGLRAGVDYFVVKATSSTFQVSTKKGGNPVDITSSGSGTLFAERIRIIGDQPGERWNSCTRPPPSLPAIFAQRVSASIVDTCVWTSENGWMK